ncbi:MAG: DUF3631 domain-containing protein [Acetobacteraceae bacterium]
MRDDAMSGAARAGTAGEGFSSQEPPPEPDDAIIERLAKLSTIEYERAREAEAKSMGLRASVLDRLVNAARPHDDATVGRFMVLRDPEPWPDPVVLAEVLTGARSAILRHVILSADAATVIALWAAHTWIYERFDFTPRLAITSPTKRCGKSTLVELLRTVCRRPLKADNISAAGTFRLVEALHPLTLLLDEADSFLRENEELRGVLNSGYEKSGMVVRVVEMKEEQRPVQFMTFAPLALAGIRRMPETIEDRSIPVRLARKAATETVHKLREHGMRQTLTALARKLCRWAADDGAKVSTDPAIPVALNDREGDISVPLLAIADAAGPQWASRARSALRTVFGASAAEGEHEAGTLLLGDIRTLYLGTSATRMAPATRMTSADLVRHLGEMEERPWPEWRQGKPMTAPQLAVALRPFGIRPTKLRADGGRPVQGYHRDAFTESWERYLVPDPPFTPPEGGSGLEHRNNADNSSEKAEKRAGTGETVFLAENVEKCSQNNECSDVPDGTPPKGENDELDGWEGTLQ